MSTDLLVEHDIVSEILVQLKQIPVNMNEE